MTLSSRHRIRNSSPGGLRPSTLTLGHGGSPQYWLLHVDGEETFFISFKPPRLGTEPRTLAWKAAVLTTTLGPPPEIDLVISEKLLHFEQYYMHVKWLTLGAATQWMDGELYIEEEISCRNINKIKILKNDNKVSLKRMSVKFTLGGHHLVFGRWCWNILETNDFWLTLHEINNFLQELFYINFWNFQCAAEPGWRKNCKKSSPPWKIHPPPPPWILNGCSLCMSSCTLPWQCCLILCKTKTFSI